MDEKLQQLASSIEIPPTISIQSWMNYTKSYKVPQANLNKGFVTLCGLAIHI